MRLTRKFKTNYYFNTDNRDIVEKDVEDDFYAAQAMRNKLGQLEDIEEKLGVELIILFKALLEGAWFKEGKPVSFIVFDSKPFLRTDIKPKPFAIDFFRSAEPHYLKDYGKTWALTKGELE